MNRPLYMQAYDAILARIASGDLGPGAMLPSEFDLGAELNVSQGTARKALGELERAGVVERRQGKGTFVAKTTTESALFQFFRLREETGAQVLPELIEETVTKRKTTAAERKAFDADHSDAFVITRLRGIAGHAAMREVSVVPTALFPGLKDRAPLPNTLYAMYQSAYGIAVVRAAEHLIAVAASAEDAGLLGVAEDTPLLEARRRAIDISGRVVEVRISRYLTEDLVYDVVLR
ncbi:MAG: GntR family transcriptional regulator [Pikeienuella sp.]